MINKLFISLLLFVFMLLSNSGVVRSEESDKTKIKQKKKAVKVVEKNNVSNEIDEISKAIRSISIDILKRQSYKSILVSKEHPLTINLSKKEDSSNEYSKIDNLNKIYTEVSPFNFSPKGNVEFGFVTDVPSGKFVAFSPGSLDGYIASGEFEFSGSFRSDHKPIMFESGRVVYKDNKMPGKFSEGTTVNYNGSKFYLNAGKWIKQ